ncbi:protein kinase, partial [bacterium]|nr:protein kinase [bacterium]
MQVHSYAEGEIFAGYKVLSSLENGSGAWSTYLAEDSNGIRVYLRLLPNHQVPSENEAEFESQIRKVSNLSHPNLPKVLRSGKTETNFYLASEWIGTDTLKTRTESSVEIELIQMLLIVRQIIQALSVALRYGITHGNLSPSSIVFDHNGRIKVDGLTGNWNINDVLTDRQLLAQLLSNSINESTRPEIYQRITKLVRFMTNPELEKTPIGYQKILEQLAPIISMCDGLKRLYDVSLFCPYCRDPLATDKLVRCAICFTAQHKSCWNEAKKCSVYNCEGKDIARIWSK